MRTGRVLGRDVPSQSGPFTTPENRVATPNGRPCPDKRFYVVTDLLKFSVAIEEDWSLIVTQGLLTLSKPSRDTTHSPNLAPRGPLWRQRTPLSQPCLPSPSPSPAATQKSCRDMELRISVVHAHCVVERAS